ncbi:tetratricopeptide repeat protein [Acinetobacter courvalinii]|uniref:tetratricopeptide repeat protein n=1 Tax=Acinetobacter courvalinii TaxID=280147 RepID=UPI0019007631|nr:tetratricopeptide repeat protein [Acinetobacter courvalinii]MBJ8417604.1 sel1 repeat family protein [Acinetobacter courvalinii]
MNFLLKPLAFIMLTSLLGTSPVLALGDTDAINTLTQYAEQGDSEAQYSLATMYADGDGVEQDNAKAVHWYLMAADQGNVNAQNNLAWMYENGKGIAQDHKKAFELYQRAAHQGDSNAQYNLGVMYAHGRGVQKDNNKAHQWYFKAAEQGDLDAQHYLRMSYLLKQLDQAEQEKYKMISKDWVIPVVEAEEANAEAY